MTSVTVIIVTYYTGPTLWLSIASALQQPECQQLIIVNNGNMAGDEKRLRELSKKESRIILLTKHGNVGFGKGCNMAAAQASGDYVLLLNPDSLIPEQGLATLLLEIKNYPKNTLAGGFLMNPNGSEQRGGRRALLNPKNAIAEGFGLSRFLKNSDNLNYNKLPMPDTTHEVPAISGAFMFLSHSFYNELQGFDEGYFLHMEDMDFCYRVRQSGGKVICVPSVRVLHFRSTSEASSTVVEKHKTKGFIRYLHKFYADQYTQNIMKLLEAGIWARCWLKIAAGVVDRAFVPPLAAKQEIAGLALLYKLTRFESHNNNLAGKTFLITGATNQIGLYIISEALSKAATVIACYKHAPLEFSHKNLKWLRCDFSRTDDINALVDIKADAFIHADELALLQNIIPLFTTNAPQRIIAFADYIPSKPSLTKNKPEKKKRFKKIRTLLVKPPTQEEEILQLAKEYAYNLTILRPFMPYGVGLDDSITPIADVIKRFGFAALYGKGSGQRNPVLVKDAANAVLNILDNPKTFGKIYDLGGDEILLYEEALELLFNYIGKPVKYKKMGMLVPGILDILGSLYQDKNINGEVARRMNRDIIADNSNAIKDFDYHSSMFLSGDVVI